MSLFVLEVAEINFLLLALKHNKETIADVMRHHYTDILEAISNNLTDIAVALCASGFISRSTRNKATERGVLSSEDKAHEVIKACEAYIITHEDPEAMLLKFLEILSETDPVGSNVAKRIRTEVR